MKKKSSMTHRKRNKSSRNNAKLKQKHRRSRRHKTGGARSTYR